jgi:ribosomal protein L20
VHHEKPKTSYLGIALEIIILIMAIIVLLYFLYKIFCFVKNKLKEKGNRNSVENDDFYDEVEEIVVKTHNISIQKPKKEKKSFKKISEISDPVSKVRYIYSIILAKLKELKIDIKKSSTSNEILKKSSALKGIEGSLSEATGIYEEVRYGNHIPNESEVASMLDDCSKIASIAEDK